MKYVFSCICLLTTHYMRFIKSYQYIRAKAAEEAAAAAKAAEAKAAAEGKKNMNLPKLWFYVLLCLLIISFLLTFIA